jgi:hypothetical protein
MNRQLRRWLKAAIIIVCISGCRPLVQPSEPVFATPEEAVRDALLGSAKTLGIDAGSLRIHGTRQGRNRSLVLYTIRYQRQPIAEMFNYYKVLRSERGWYVTHGSGFGGETVPAQQRLLLKTDRGVIDNDRYLIVYGQVRTPDVAAVEILLSSGATARDAVAGQVFAFDLLPTEDVCEIRALGENGTLIERYDSLGQIRRDATPGCVPTLSYP